MKKTIQLVIALSMGLILSINSSASHVTGINVTYKHISAQKYEFKAVAQRDCRGVSTSVLSLSFTIKGTSYTKTVSLYRRSIVDITPLCSSAPVPCYPVNTYGTGYGFEEHVYSDTVDFADSFFQTSPWDTACEILVATGQCCRSGSITTGQANANYYTEIWFNRCLGPNNSNPSSGDRNIYTIYCQSPFYRYLTNTDADGDSLSYKLAPQLQNPGSIISYNIGDNCNRPLSATEPLSTFLPKPCFGNIPIPNMDLPVGFYFDEKNALCAFTPINCNELTTVTYVVTEHRKDTNGVYHVISENRKDLTIHVVTPSGNNPPTINTNKIYYVPAGSVFGLDITLTDNPFIPPPPATNVPPPDTVTLTWDSGISNANTTFTIIDTSRLQVGKLIWETTCNDISSTPYKFMLTANDNHCPWPAEVTREVQIRVIASPPANLGADKNVCEGTTVTLGNGFNHKSYLWSTNDSTPYISVSTPGDYWLRAISYCGDTTFDTVKVIHHAKPVVKLPNDTAICESSTYDVGVNVLNALSYSWNTGQTTNQITIDSIGFYEVTVVDKYCGTFKDDINITNKFPPTVDLGEDKPYCKEVNKTLTAQNDGISTFLWSTGKKTAAIYVTKPDVYWVKVTNACGAVADTVDYSDNTPPLNLNLGPDTLVCDNKLITLSSNIDADEYVWSTFGNTKSITVNQPGQYILRVDKCQQRDFDTIQVDFKETPMIDLGADQQVDSPFSIQLDAGVIADSYLWSTNEDTKTISVSSRGTYWVAATNICGTGRDSITILVNGILRNTAIAESIKVYPNPVTDKAITISFTEAEAQNITISVVAITGKEVYTEKIRVSGNQNHSIKPGDLPAGIYFLQLRSAKGTATVKLSVE